MSKKNKRKPDQPRRRPEEKCWGLTNKQFAIGLVILAGALRLIYLLQVRDNPFFESPTLDPAFHLNWAKDILAGNFMGSDVFFRAPLYPYLLAFFHALASGDLFIIRMIQHVLGVAMVWGIYRTTRGLYTEVAGRIAGLAAAVYATLMYFENELLLDFLLVGWMLLLVYSMHRIAQKPTVKWLLMTGLSVGLFAITRPNILLCIPVVLWWVWSVTGASMALSQRFRRLVIVGVGILIPILPITVRNAVVGHDFVLISSQGGINFFIGNNSEADGVSAVMPDPWGATWRLPDVQRYAEDQTGHVLKPSQHSSFWYGEGLSWWVENPGDAVGLAVKKSILLLSNTEISNNQDIALFWESYAPLKRFLPLSFGIVAAFGLVGLIARSRQDRFTRFVLLLLAVYALSVVLFFVPARFRLPLLPLMFIGCGGFSAWVIQVIRTGRIARAALWAVPVAALLIVSFVPWFTVRPADDNQSTFALANAALRKHNFATAGRLYDEVLKKNPNYPHAHLNLGVIALYMGQTSFAKSEFEKEIQINPNSGRAYANLCSVYREEEDWMRAYEMGKEALDREPDNVTALLGLADVHLKLKNPNRAASLIETAPRLVRESPVGLQVLGLAYLRLGRFDDAVTLMQPLLLGTTRIKSDQYLPDIPFIKGQLGYDRLANHQAEANYNIAWYLGGTRDPQRAKRYLEMAIGLDSNFTKAIGNLGTIMLTLGDPDSALALFRRASTLEPDNPGQIYNRGIALLHLGDTTAAIERFYEATLVDTVYAPAWRKLRELGLE